MAFDIGVIPETVTRALTDRTLIPVIGAGLSKQSNPNFPTWSELLAMLVAYAAEQHFITPPETEELQDMLCRNKFSMVGTRLRSRIPLYELEVLMQRLFAPKNARPSLAHQRLLELAPVLIMTTNYDMLLEDAYATHYSAYANDYTYRDAALVLQYLESQTPSETVIFKIFGSIDEPSELIITQNDYWAALYETRPLRHLLSYIYESYIILILGYAVTDAAINTLMEANHAIRRKRRGADNIFMVVAESESDSPVADWGVQLIRHHFSTGEPEWPEVLEELRRFVGDRR